MYQMSLTSHLKHAAIICFVLWVACRSQVPTVPNVCYNVCNDAYIEAQQIGNVPALCSAGSPFLISLSNCNSCVEAHSDNSTSPKIYVIPVFTNFISYCSEITSSIPIISSSIAAPILSSISLELSSLEAEASSLRISYSQLEQATDQAFITTSATPELSITTVYATITPLIIPSSTSSGSANPSSTDLSSVSSTTSSTSHTWIAGVVIGLVAGIVAIAVLIFFMRRWMRKESVEEITPSIDKEPNFEKAQLQADSLLREDPSELVGSPVVRAELPAREDVAIEIADQNREVI